MLFILFARTQDAYDLASISLALSWGMLISNINYVVAFDAALWRKLNNGFNSFGLGLASSISVSTFMLFAGASLAYLQSSSVVFGAVLYSFGYSTIIYTRRILVMNERSSEAILVSTAFSVLSMVSIYFCSDYLSWIPLLGIFSALCLVIVLPFAVRYGFAEVNFISKATEGLTEWGWLIPGALILWVPANIIFITLQLYGGGALAGEARQYLHIITPLLIMNSVTAVLLVREIALNQRVFSLLALVLTVNVIYVATVSILFDMIFDRLYSAHGSFSNLVPLLAVPLLTLACAYFSASLRAKNDYLMMILVYSFGVVLATIIILFFRGFFTSDLSGFLKTPALMYLILTIGLGLRAQTVCFRA